MNRIKQPRKALFVLALSVSGIKTQRDFCDKNGIDRYNLSKTLSGKSSVKKIIEKVDSFIVKELSKINIKPTIQ
jgi:hypothetical protein